MGGSSSCDDGHRVAATLEMCSFSAYALFILTVVAMMWFDACSFLGVFFPITTSLAAPAAASAGCWGLWGASPEFFSCESQRAPGEQQPHHAVVVLRSFGDGGLGAAPSGGGGVGERVVFCLSTLIIRIIGDRYQPVWPQQVLARRGRAAAAGLPPRKMSIFLPPSRRAAARRRLR